MPPPQQHSNIFALFLVAGADSISNYRSCNLKIKLLSARWQQ